MCRRAVRPECSLLMRTRIRYSRADFGMYSRLKEEDWLTLLVLLLEVEGFLGVVVDHKLIGVVKLILWIL